MALPNRAASPLLFMAVFAGLSTAQEWTEASVVETFLDQSPYARESRARVAVAEAEARGRALYPNPSFSYSREGAGFTEFFLAEQTLPITGRLKLLRAAGSTVVRAAEAEGAFSLWHARSSLRQSFYRQLASQEREIVVVIGLTELEGVIRVLRDREREGEGSKFDRLRAERERAELMAELALIQSDTASARAQVLSFLPHDTQLAKVSGRMECPAPLLDVEVLTRRALELRGDYRAELQRVAQYKLEQRAADRLRYPEPVLVAGIKRSDVGLPEFQRGLALSITVPLPLFNKGQTEVARFSAELERATARLQILSQQIRGTVEGAARSLAIRLKARDDYRRHLGDTGPELVSIATVAYQEGEIGILQLLDAYRTQRQAQLRMLDIQASVKETQIELERVLGEELK